MDRASCSLPRALMGRPLWFRGWGSPGRRALALLGVANRRFVGLPVPGVDPVAEAEPAPVAEARQPPLDPPAADEAVAWHAVEGVRAARRDGLRRVEPALDGRADALGEVQRGQP